MLRRADKERLLRFLIRIVHQPAELIRSLEAAVANEPRSRGKNQRVEMAEHQQVELCVDSLLRLEPEQRSEQTTQPCTTTTDLIAVGQQNLRVINLE